MIWDLGIQFKLGFNSVHWQFYNVPAGKNTDAFSFSKTASAEGYVSRIKISTFGNGKTIYITHPNGYTSVYAHLQKAVGRIQDFITATHYKEQAFEIEMYLKPGEIPINKGEWIAIIRSNFWIVCRRS